MHPWRLLRLSVVLFFAAAPAFGQTASVATAINQLGLDLVRAQPAGRGDENLLLSPYSIETALAMAFVGADGPTRDEMRRVLHLPADDAAVTRGFAALIDKLAQMEAVSKQRSESERQFGGTLGSIEINVANRLFAQSGFALLPTFTATLRDPFHAPLEEMDFANAAEPSRVKINDWVARETHDKIRDLIPDGALDATTRVVLTNAIYLKAPWADPFEEARTKPASFWVGGKTMTDVPMMERQGSCGYEKLEGFAALALPYVSGGLQFLILLPDERDGLENLRRTITAEKLTTLAHLPRNEVKLRLPKFKIEPPVLPLGELLRRLGMTTAFDQPAGSANFDRMAPRKNGGHLYISEVFHKTWLSLDEKGTEAAAATAAGMVVLGAPLQKPPTIDVDHPFLFAIQHVESGACLFLGSLSDPR